MALTQEQIQSLKVGQSLRVNTRFGMGKYEPDAKVAVVEIGKAACLVQVIEDFSMGEDNAAVCGQELVVTFAELEVLPE